MKNIVANGSVMNNNVTMSSIDSVGNRQNETNFLKESSLTPNDPSTNHCGNGVTASRRLTQDDATTKIENGHSWIPTSSCKEGGVCKRSVHNRRSRDIDGSSSEKSKVEREQVNQVPTRLQIISDPANICTFTGAILAMLALASMWTGRYYLGMFFNVAANIADIIDGPIARSMPNRLPAFSVVGSKLDCYADLVSHFVVPASLLMHLGGLNLFPVLLAGVYVCSGIMRQSYFEITGRCEGGQCIFGLTSDYMVGIYTLTMLLHPLIGSSTNLVLFALVATILFMIFCSLTFSLRSRRYDGLNLLLVSLYNILLCCSCGLLAFYSDNSTILTLVSSVSFPVLAILAYPLYFRHVEINH